MRCVVEMRREKCEGRNSTSTVSLASDEGSRHGRIRSPTGATYRSGGLLHVLAAWLTAAYPFVGKFFSRPIAPAAVAHRTIPSFVTLSLYRQELNPNNEDVVGVESGICVHREF